MLKRIAEQTWCTVSLTIITFNQELLPYLEPFAPSPERRLEAIKKLNGAGIQAGIDFTPIVPYFLDNPDNIEEVIKRASGCAKYILIGAAMTLRSNQRVRFLGLLKKNFAELAEKFENLYDKQESPPKDYIVALNRCAFKFSKKYGIKNYIPPPSFERPLRENFEIANLLLLVAFFKEFKSVNPYSAWAYHRASQSIENLNESIKEIYKRKELRKISGVGESISKVIEEILANRRSEKLEKEMSAW